MTERVQYLSRLSFPAERFGDSENAVSCDTLNDVLAVGCDKFDLVTILLYANEGRCRELINNAPSLAVQMQGNTIACLVGLLAMP